MPAKVKGASKARAMKKAKKAGTGTPKKARAPKKAKKAGSRAPKKAPQKARTAKKTGAQKKATAGAPKKTRATAQKKATARVPKKTRATAQTKATAGVPKKTRARAPKKAGVKAPDKAPHRDRADAEPRRVVRDSGSAASVTGRRQRSFAGPTMFDGASARRAASATASFQDQPPRARAAEFAGPSLDVDAESPDQTEGLLGQARRIEHRVTRRFLGVSPYQGSQSSVLDRIGALTRGSTYRQWLSRWMMHTRSDVVDDFGLDPVFADRWRPLFEFLYRQYWRVETAGMENVPDSGRALLVANHSGTLPYDGAMIMYAVRHDHPAHRDVRPLVEDLVFHFPYLGMFLNRIGCVRACQDNAERLLQQDRIAAVFPEGIKGISKLYRHRYQLQRFGRGGFIKLAFKTRTPIIPTSVVGAEEIYPMLTKVTWLAKYLGIPFIPITPIFPWLGPLGTIPLPTKWRIRFGQPLDLVSRYGPDAYRDRILVNKLSEQVRSTIQSMVDETLSDRRSVVFG